MNSGQGIKSAAFFLFNKRRRTASKTTVMKAPKHENGRGYGNGSPVFERKKKKALRTTKCNDRERRVNTTEEHDKSPVLGRKMQRKSLRMYNNRNDRDEGVIEEYDKRGVFHPDTLTHHKKKIP